MKQHWKDSGFLGGNHPLKFTFALVCSTDKPNRVKDIGYERECFLWQGPHSGSEFKASFLASFLHFLCPLMPPHCMTMWNLVLLFLC